MPLRLAICTPPPSQPDPDNGHLASQQQERRLLRGSGRRLSSTQPGTRVGAWSTQGALQLVEPQKRKPRPTRTHRDAGAGARTEAGAQRPALPQPGSAVGSRSASPYCAPRVAGDGHPVPSPTVRPRPQDTPSPDLSLGPAQEWRLALLPSGRLSLQLAEWVRLEPRIVRCSV